MSFGAEYAEFYEQVYAQKDYASEARAVVDGLQARPGAEILELGCGSGPHARELAKLGMRVHGIDIAPEMIARAVPCEGVTLEVADIRSFDAHRQFDHVIALFHVMSYQEQNMDLQAAFMTAGRHVRRGGKFLFDFWNGARILPAMPQRTEERVNGTTRICEPLWDPGANVFELQMTLTHGEEAVIEKHRMRYLFIPEIKWMLINAGFTAFEANIDNWFGIAVATK
jgi:SAM-dependent methyltransferase